jgi:uncharacterized protein (TIGR03032 family)
VPQQIEIVCSPYFLEFLQANAISIGLTTYQTNRLFLFGLKTDQSLSVFERLFDRPMGLYTESDRLFLATRSQIWQFCNVLAENETERGYDRLFIPRIGYTTGELDIHDVNLDDNQHPLFVNTLYSCLATVSDRFSFDVVWKPPFISALVPEDRCHLNGMAVEKGQPLYVTAISGSDTASGWRASKKNSGLLIHVASNEIVSANLSMPHSPRLYGNKLWLLNAGSGAFGYIDLKSGHFETVLVCPGYLRGLSFFQGFAVVALSMPRYKNEFSGLPLEAVLNARGSKPFCGAMVIDLERGTVAHWLQFKGGRVTELYDIQILPGVRCPSLLGFKNNQIDKSISFLEQQQITRHTLLEKGKGKQRGGGASPVSADQSTTGDTSICLAMRSHEVMARYGHMTFPAIAQRLSVKRLQEPLFCSLVFKNSQAVALGVIEIDEDARASVISLAVHPAYRSQGLGTRLLLSLEQEALRQKATAINIQYRKSWDSVPQLEGILQTCGWIEPKPLSLQCKTDIEHISRAPWIQTERLPAGSSLFPWSELRRQEREEIEQRSDYPTFLTPFQEEGKISLETSFGLRSRGAVKGWLITHRTKQDTIQYSSLFVEKGRKHGGCALDLLAAAIRQQIALRVPFFIFMINEGNQAGRNLTNRRIRPYLLSAVEVYSSKKPILAAGDESLSR